MFNIINEQKNSNESHNELPRQVIIMLKLKYLTLLSLDKDVDQVELSYTAV